MVDRKAVEKAITDLLIAFNVDLNDPNLVDTPERVAKAYQDFWLSGYDKNHDDLTTVFPNDSIGDLVLVKDINFYSLCSHHLAPFKGKVAVAYIPSSKGYIGLSKIPRLVDMYARRLQLQERLTAQVADALVEILDPQGVMVVLYNVEHMCMTSRGVGQHESVTTTSALRGKFHHSEDGSIALRNEVLSLLNLGSG